MYKYLVTGANGFVGSALMERLSDQAVAAVRTASNSKFINTKHIDDINSNTDWSNCLEGIDVVVHLAGIASKSGYSSDEYNEINNLGTVKLAKDAAENGVKRFIFVSTIAVMGLTGTFTEESEVNPQNDYAKSKLAAEQGLQQLASETNMEIVILRPTLVYGAGAKGNFVVLQKLTERLPVLPFAMTKNKRSFISRENLVDLIITCATKDEAAGQTFLASEGPALSTKEFTNAIAKGLNSRVTQLPFPGSIAKILFKLINRPTMYSQLFEDLEVKSTKLKDILNWTAPKSIAQNMAELKETKQ
ncbi:NAD-dependent epimerase/dehydratase family protein [Vibrio ezurae]|uniref:Putative UDP-sugar epimerase n=1 Tax=Vibrio ezurae NBRC 102218 TaxID=1219080 RepID=U3AIA2_9VIBR|nr:NAD-dependent epimerase/dehydratase family protein [Vibrio ezurae]GAD79656.1 putative UDP-sugar epimerase [Vibrio ezurae NBRC 102218]